MADGMEVDVASVLSAAEKDAEGKFKSIDVKKDIDPELDVGNLLAIDLQPIDLRELRWVTTHVWWVVHVREVSIYKWLLFRLAKRKYYNFKWATFASEYRAKF